MVTFVYAAVGSLRACVYCGNGRDLVMQNIHDQLVALGKETHISDLLMFMMFILNIICCQVCGGCHICSSHRTFSILGRLRSRNVSIVRIGDHNGEHGPKEL